MTNNTWDADNYDRTFGFVTDHGAAVLDLLGPVGGMSVIDIGSGTGHLTAALLARGATRVVGLDASPEMVRSARRAYPGISFVLGDAQDMTLAAVGGMPFDAAFSNAALHWMPRGDLVARSVRAVLRQGAGFAAELGGVGNVAAIDAAVRASLVAVGLDPALLPRNTFPSMGQQSSWLEDAGFRVRLMRWFERPTRLPPGTSAADWTRHFRARMWESVPQPATAPLVAAIGQHAAAAGLLGNDGWHIDYCRLQFVAHAL